ncbi:GNAT family N-acetyltransferase [Streptomyces sp. NPDC048197]|uniref:GNAT family N-acetyltransferase n=1 Tax=Streptomyces sp. NPDC048197 TaxID=3365511 RepID=UPI003722790B
MRSSSRSSRSVDQIGPTAVPWGRFVENVVVASSFQRLGIGRQLMEAAIQLGEAAGCYKVQLLAADEAYVHRFYEACGFNARAHGFRRYMDEHADMRS